MRGGAQHRRRPAADRPSPEGRLGVAAARARAAGTRRHERLRSRIPTTSAPIPARRWSTCPAIPRAAGWSACCGAANSRSPPSSTRPTAPIPRMSTSARKIFEGWVDGINATDGSGAHCHMSSVAICALLTRVGYSPVLQISCRDYNRIAIQGNVLGAAALEVGNILCLTGDGVQCGDHPEAKPVFDLDSTSLLRGHQAHARRGQVPVGAQDHHAAARLPRRGGKSVRAALRFPPAAARQEDRRRRAIRARRNIASTCRACRAFMARARDSGSTRNVSSWSASGRSPRPRPRAGCAPMSRACISPTR